MKKKLSKRILAILLCAVLLTAAFIPASLAFAKDEDDDDEVISKYPFVYVHGLFGWGADEKINDALSYWGATSCQLIDEMNAKGYESYAASVGPMSSCWDRVCELYAQLTGTRVDYGAAHSKSHNHARYGRTYEEPIFEGWGEKDEDGEIQKVNLIGHSFGGATVRMLTYLMAEGSPEERAVTSEEDLSPLFKGGHKDWVNSVVALCAPHDGTTLAYMFARTNTVKLAETMCFFSAGVLGRTPINGILDFHLESFGLTPVPGSGEKASEELIPAFTNFMGVDDKAMDDLFPDGAKKINDMIDVVDGVYYFSYAYQTSRKSPVGNFQYPTITTNPALFAFSWSIGTHPVNNTSDYKIDETWLPNDGMVNVVSALHPSDEPFKDFDEDEDFDDLESGIWHVMPVRKGDHGTAIGLLKSKDYTVNFYSEISEMVNELD